MGINYPSYLDEANRVLRPSFALCVLSLYLSSTHLGHRCVRYAPHAGLWYLSIVGRSQMLYFLPCFGIPRSGSFDLDDLIGIFVWGD
ncbi:hypothetical protein ZEAMMB73_Zm00001d017074 [Zea mays]|uniref:Uncharacterized protein n=1 Tax=Zea mays TaxID=4577 RepID=A0A1D6HC16_MAIZE|nr:hypothetical protein ZEAMMB73_Zm00001d017074 [Zea mays]